MPIGRVLLFSTFVLLCAAAARAQTEPAALSPAQITAACAPAMAVPPAPGTGLRVVGGQDTVPRSLFGPRDLVVVTGGADAGVKVGQQFFVRRPYQFGKTGSSAARKQPQSIHTTGWLRIVAVNDGTAIGLVETGCDGIIAGDYLEPFVAPPPVESVEALTPASLDFSALSRVKYASEERTLGAAGDFMLVDSGNAPLSPGTRVALYRDIDSAGMPLSAIGEGVIVSVTNGTPLMRITTTRDAVRAGDYVVPHK
jgi:hypothetical protein